MRILLCDDSMTVRKRLAQQIREIYSVDMDILEAINGVAAVEAYKARRPDYVIMDIMMPVKDGLTALQEIMDFDSSARVIMLSSLGTKENLKEALKIGAIDFIQKPADSQRLADIFKTSEED